MWCCWIFHDRNPASTQQRVLNIGLRESLKNMRHASRSARWRSRGAHCIRLKKPPDNLLQLENARHRRFNQLKVRRGSWSLPLIATG